MRALILAVTLLIPVAASAQGLQAVRPLRGYACMSLAASEQVMRSPARLPPVLAQPSADAPRIGIAGATVIAVSPVRLAGGYVQVLHLNGHFGWVEAAKLRPWRSLSNPAATCTPMLMNDGKPGFR